MGRTDRPIDQFDEPEFVSEHNFGAQPSGNSGHTFSCLAHCRARKPARAFLWSGAADIGVWPRQESTSQLDAMACGLPLVLSNKVQVPERVDGNGLVYEEGSPRDLAKQLQALFDSDQRRSMGQIGSRRIVEGLSWNDIAEGRVRDYEEAL